MNYDEIDPELGMLANCLNLSLIFTITVVCLTFLGLLIGCWTTNCSICDCLCECLNDCCDKCCLNTSNRSNSRRKKIKGPKVDLKKRELMEKVKRDLEKVKEDQIRIQNQFKDQEKRELDPQTE